AVRLAPGDLAIHELLLDRVIRSTDEPAEPARIDTLLERVWVKLDALAQELGLSGGSLAQLWSAALTLLETRYAEHEDDLNPQITAAVRARVHAAIDEPEQFTALLELLRARRRWADVLDLLLEADERHAALDPAALD